MARRYRPPRRPARRAPHRATRRHGWPSATTILAVAVVILASAVASHHAGTFAVGLVLFAPFLPYAFISRRRHRGHG
jgi:hypothetical protein